MFYVMYTISSIWHILEQYHINTKTAKQSSLNTSVKSTCLNTKTKTYVIEDYFFKGLEIVSNHILNEQVFHCTARNLLKNDKK